MLVHFVMGLTPAQSVRGFTGSLTTSPALAGVAIVAPAAVAALRIGQRVLRIPLGILSGLLVGIQTQSAMLAFAHQQLWDGSPSEGYAPSTRWPSSPK